MVERGNRHKDSHRYILLSCMLAVVTRHNRNREGKAPDEPEAVGTASGSITRKERRRRSLPEGRGGGMSISRDLAAGAKTQRHKNAWPVFSPRKRCAGISVSLILQLAWWEHWAGEPKIRLFISTHLRQWASISGWPHYCNTAAVILACQLTDVGLVSVSPHPCGWGSADVSVHIHDHNWKMTPGWSSDDELLA